MVMTFLPGSPAVTPLRDDLRRLAVADPLRTYISNMAALAAYWPLDDTSGIVARVVNPALAEGRQLVLNPTPSSSTSWTLNAGWGYGSNLFTHTAGSANTVTQALAGAVVVGRIYKVAFTISGSTTGTVTASLTASGAAQTGNSSFTDSILATGTTLAFTPSSAFDGSISGFSVTEVGLPASSGFPTLELVKDPGFDYPLSAWPAATNWTQGSSKATHTTGSVTALTQTLSIIIGRSYDCVVTVSGRTAGSVTPRAGSTGTGGSAISANGTAAAQTLTCAGSAALALVPTTDFDGSIDNVSVVPHDGLVVWNSDGSTTTGWTAVNSATLSSVSGWLRVQRSTVDNPIAAQGCLKIGSTYLITVTFRGDGTAKPVVSASANNIIGTASNTPQTVPGIIVATTINLNLFASGATGTGYAEFQNLVITELAPMSGAQVNGIGINQTSGNTLLDPVYLDDGVNDAVNVNSGSFNSAINPAQWTLGVFAQITAAANWSNGSVYYLLNRAVDASNKAAIYKSAANTVTFLYLAGGTSKSVTYTWSGLGWHHYAMTIDKTNDLMIAYVDGVEVGRATGLGVWVGNLSSTLTAVGAINSSGGNAWPGYLASGFDASAALAPDVLLTIAGLGGCA